ncbi:hypothetical protein SAMN02745723_10272 [Pragia fontium DSM 5563 = ATCC 49100]|uniref:Uncharacterized protein n=2 Tax=Pragia fontium TaxID=82985 RepID=A0AAJ4W8Q5_9GAMM|nr:hypothetical protein SAMN02745723_10272 [Pragia fontium DSM 5563 = ATCC 49100]VEJ54449.1 Transposase and inactivated derivatives [Pragia fontium]
MRVNKTPCRFCGEVEGVRKHGSGKSTKIQRYYCTHCAKTFQAKYIYNIIQPDVSSSDVVNKTRYSSTNSVNSSTMMNN